VLHPAKLFLQPPQSDFRRKYIEKDRKKLDVSFRCRLVGSYRSFGTISSPSSRKKQSKKNKVVEWISMAHNGNRWLPGINRLKQVQENGNFLTYSSPIAFSSRTFFREFITYLPHKVVENVRLLLVCLDILGYYVIAAVNLKDKLS
jgi:hypothetical protein